MLGLARNYDEEARELVRHLDLEESVRFISFTRDTTQLYQASDVVVSPSRGLELGRPVIESAACGRVVIASGSLDGGGIVQPAETGFLVPQRSPDVLAAAIEQLIRDPDMRFRLGENARRFAQENFSASANAKRVMDTYDEILGGAS
jgi:glycosyltransferase involved in cell wall biosynthesis